MYKQFAVCLIFISVFGCGVKGHDKFTPIKGALVVPFWKVIRDHETYRTMPYQLVFEAVTTQVSNDSVMLKTNREHISFTIKSGGVPMRSMEDGKAVPLRLNQKYKFRCRISGLQYSVPVPNDRSMPKVHIFADLILTPDKKKVLYSPILIEYPCLKSKTARSLKEYHMLKYIIVPRFIGLETM
ncbi:MAG: hypothetical protein OXI43_02865 [Candidatus Poribacteria bacterium]|nr:hypothetical protein [Candidatus Poribacteria bacterium]